MSRERSRGMLRGCRVGCRENVEGCIIERSCRVTPDRHHRWRIRLASGSKQAARATPTARSACFVPLSADHGVIPCFGCLDWWKNQIFSLHFETFFWNRHYNRGTTRRCCRIRASSAQETVRFQQLQHRKLTHFLSWQNFSNTTQLVPRFGSRCDYLCCEFESKGMTGNCTNKHNTLLTNTITKIIKFILRYHFNLWPLHHWFTKTSDKIDSTTLKLYRQNDQVTKFHQAISLYH